MNDFPTVKGEVIKRTPYNYDYVINIRYIKSYIPVVYI